MNFTEHELTPSAAAQNIAAFSLCLLTPLGTPHRAQVATRGLGHQMSNR